MNNSKKKKLFQAINKINKRIYFKGFSKKVLEQIRFRNDILIAEIRLIKTNLYLLRFTKRNFAKLLPLIPLVSPLVEIVRPVVSNEANANQFLENYSLVGGAGKLPNELDLLEQVFSSNILNLEKSSLNSINDNKEEIYEFFCTHPNIKFNKERDKFDVLYSLAEDCLTGKIQTQKQLQDAIRVRGGFDTQVIWQLLIVIILVIMLNNDINSLNAQPLPNDVNEFLQRFSSSKLNKNPSKFLFSFGERRHCTFIPPVGSKDSCKAREEGATICPATPLQNNEENDNSYGNENINPNPRRRCVEAKLDQHDGRVIFVHLSQARRKAYHIPAFMSDDEISQLGGNPDEIKMWEKGKSLDGTLRKNNPEQAEKFYAERSKYFSNRNKVPERLVRAFAEKLLQTSYDPEAQIEQGVMGSQKTPGSVIFIERDQKVIFHNEAGEVRSGAILKGNEEKGQWANFLASGKEGGVYVLFPGNKL